MARFGVGGTGVREPESCSAGELDEVTEWRASDVFRGVALVTLVDAASSSMHNWKPWATR